MNLSIMEDIIDSMIEESWMSVNEFIGFDLFTALTLLQEIPPKSEYSRLLIATRNLSIHYYGNIESPSITLTKFLKRYRR